MQDLQLIFFFVVGFASLQAAAVVVLVCLDVVAFASHG